MEYVNIINILAKILFIVHLKFNFNCVPIQKSLCLPRRLACDFGQPRINLSNSSASPLHYYKSDSQIFKNENQLSFMMPELKGQVGLGLRGVGGTSSSCFAIQHLCYVGQIIHIFKP